VDLGGFRADMSVIMPFMDAAGSTPITLRDRFLGGREFDEMLANARKNAELWLWLGQSVDARALAVFESILRS
jgi:hypothetical protein